MPEFNQDLQKYNRQLKKGFNALRFNAGLEAEFRTFFYARNVVKQRGAIIVGIILLLGLVPIDLRLIDGEAAHFYLLIRVWITVPLLLVALAFTFRTSQQHYFSLFSFFIIIFIGITTNIQVVYTMGLGQFAAYEGLMLIIMVAFFLGGMLFRQSLACIIIISLSYLIMSELYLSTSSYSFHRYYFLFATCLIGGVSAYTLEYQLRISYLQRGALRSLAKTDPLTGLYNRGAIADKLNHLVEYGYREQKPITLLMIDVDYFKNYNDCYGHIQGDTCLVSVAQALIKNCKRPLDFAGRYGGEEFLIMWFDAQPNEAKTFAEKTKATLDRLNIPHANSEVATHVTISGGMITGVPDRPDIQAAILHQADQCLYRAKESGRNRIIIQEVGEDHSISSVVK
ncbi:GGDEF domain-containing protein [Ketobacter sp.]